MNNQIFDVKTINSMAENNSKTLVEEGENFYINQISQLASTIVAKGKKIILVSGASSAGKTTSSHILQDKLAGLGVSSFVLSMDDFFNNTEDLPLREDGKPDIENLVALDVDAIRKSLSEIISFGKTSVPQFDFATHKRMKEWKVCNLHNNEVVLMEGIHALNPEIIKGLDLEKIMRVYVYCQGEFVLNGSTILNGKDLRLIRRAIRDERDREAPIEETLSIWQEVCKGEDNNITPFKHLADFSLNTIHSFEPCLYSSIAKQKFCNFNNPLSQKVCQSLENFSIIKEELVPQDSVVREFIGYTNK